jgi:CheY-like chemotaxis protein
MTVESSSSGTAADRFLSDLAHDLRNLLEGLDLELFTAASSHPETRDMTHREILHLIIKIESHLDASRLRDGRVVLVPSPVDLDEVCRSSIERLQPFLRRRRLVYDDNSDASFASADPVSTSRVVGRLLHAASRLTTADDSVCVSLGSTEGRTEVRVAFPAGTISKDRVEELLSISDESGFGLGVSRALASLQGGELRSELTEGVDVRSLRFVLSLPDHPERPAAATPSKSTGEKLSILIVDDNVDAAVSLAMLLSLSGYETEVRHDGRSALDAAAGMTPDVVLVDLGLPDIDGFEVCRALRRGSAASALKVVAVSGRDDDETRRLSVEAGFDAHLIKPIARAQLMRLLEGV